MRKNHITLVLGVLPTVNYGSKNILWYGIDLFLGVVYNIINNWKYFCACRSKYNVVQTTT